MKAWRVALWLTGAGLGVALPAVALETEPSPQTGAERRRAAEADLLAQMHYNNQQEIALGRLGAQRSPSPAVRKLGQRIARDYERLDTTLTRLAQRRGVDLNTYPPPLKPGPVAAEEHRELPSLTGRKFDQQFLETVIADERVIISTTQQNARPAQLNDLQIATIKSAPVHRDTAVDLMRAQQWKVGIPTIPPPLKIAPK